MWLTGLKTGGHIGIYKRIRWQIPRSIPMLSTYVKTLSLPIKHAATNKIPSDLKLQEWLCFKHAVTNKIPSDLKLQEWLCWRNSSLSRQLARVWCCSSSFLTVWIYKLPLICIYFARYISVRADVEVPNSSTVMTTFYFRITPRSPQTCRVASCILCRLDTNCAGKGAPFCTKHSTNLPDNITIIC